MGVHGSLVLGQEAVAAALRSSFTAGRVYLVAAFLPPAFVQSSLRQGKRPRLFCCAGVSVSLRTEVTIVNRK